MSQRNGTKIPTMPNTMCPFWKVSRQTVKRRKKYRMNSVDVRIQSKAVMARYLLAVVTSSTQRSIGAGSIGYTANPGSPQ
jgi:hypothetical protein